MTTTPTITDLVSDARAGDRDAFAALVRRHQRASLAYARHLLGEARAEEAVQDAFLEAWSALDRLREPAAFPGWLRRIVHKQCDRRMRRRSEVPTDRAEAVGDGPGPDPDAEAAWRILRARVEALPAHERVVVALHHLGGVPIREIAAFLDLSPGAVKTRLSRARARLRTPLEVPVSALPALDDAVALFLAIRAGDRPTLRRLVRERPDLLEREEAWSDAEALAGGFPLAHPRTPLMLAASLGRTALVEDLLAAGADPAGRCACANGESAAWLAARFGHWHIVDILARAGAVEDPPHPSGLDRAGLQAWRDAAPAPGWQQDGPRVHTGIGAVDLWLAPHAGDVVRVVGAAETGLTVLLSELSRAVAGAGGRALWTAWAPRPWHVDELEGIARRGGIEAHVDLVTPATRDLSAPEEVVPTALAHARTLDGPVLHILFEDAAHRLDLAAHLTALGDAATLTLVVAPWAETTAGVAPDDAWTGDGWLVTSPDLARAGIWPAVDPDHTRGRSWDLGARGRAGLDGPHREALLRRLLQPFHTAQPDTGWPGQRWSVEDLAAKVEG